MFKSTTLSFSHVRSISLPRPQGLLCHHNLCIIACSLQTRPHLLSQLSYSTSSLSSCSQTHIVMAWECDLPNWGSQSYLVLIELVILRYIAPTKWSFLVATIIRISKLTVLSLDTLVSFHSLRSILTSTLRHRTIILAWLSRRNGLTNKNLVNLKTFKWKSNFLLFPFCLTYKQTKGPLISPTTVEYNSSISKLI